MTMLVLASKSPRRKDLLSVLGIPFSVQAAEIDETPRAGESPEAYVTRMAREKATEVAERLTNSLVLSADTIVTIDGTILGKPSSIEDAARMLRLLSGREHEVLTAVCLIDQIHGAVFDAIDRTAVWFRTMQEAEIRDYIQREDVLDKAGSYAIQGYASVYIPRIEGSYSNVMGLPMPVAFDLLNRTGRSKGLEG